MRDPRCLYDLTNRIAVVTGASSGLGQMTATVLAHAGAKVVGVARRADRLNAWAAGCNSETAVHAADIADPASIDAIAAAAAAPFGPPDILVNAAGINPRQPADTIAPEIWAQTLWINLTAPFLLARALVPGMRAKGWGRIVNFASLQSRRAMPNGIAYGASKGGVEQMTRAMAEAWSADGVMCNAIAPGFFQTELTAAVFADTAMAEKNARQTCLGRNGELADIAGPILFLCAPASDYVTGQILFVDGGFTAK